MTYAVNPDSTMSRAAKWIGWTVIALVLLIPAVVVLVDANHFRGTLSRLVTEKTGRELAIKGDLQWHLDWPRIRLHAVDVTFANPAWAQEKLMIDAPGAFVSVDLPRLFAGTVFLAEVELERAAVFFEVAADGRKNWLLDREQRDEGARAAVGRLQLREGRVHYDDPTAGTSIVAEISTPATRPGTRRENDPGIAFDATGKYLGLPLSAKGTGGTLLGMRDESIPFPLTVAATVGPTSLHLQGTVADVLQKRVLDATFALRGASLAELFDVLDLPLPETRAYTISGHLTHDGTEWRYQTFTGRIGRSDVAGSLAFTEGPARPLAKGEMMFSTLDLADLGPVVGKNAAGESASLRGRKAPEPKGGSATRTLPARPFNRDRWTDVDADVQLKAQTILRPQALPLERLTTRLRMRESVLTLDPLDFGAAGGSLTGSITLDGQQEPIRAHAKLAVRKLLLAKLLPTVPGTEKSVGHVNGEIELVGQGDSVARMLGTADGKVGLVVDGGRVSKRLLEQMALHIPEILLQQIAGDELVDIRCGIADFVVEDGVMQARTLVLDTDVVKVSGTGSTDLAKETLSLTLVPRPKKPSLFALRGAITVHGQLGAPEVSVDTSRTAARGLAALALAAINPALALLPLADSGSGKDSDCVALTRQTQAPWRSTAVTQKPQKRTPG